MKKAKPGQWYFYVECPYCEDQIIFQKEPAPELIEQAYSKGVTAKCPHCGKKNTYPAARAGPGQWRCLRREGQCRANARLFLLRSVSSELQADLAACGNVEDNLSKLPTVSAE